MSSRGVPTQIRHLSGQFPEAIYKVRQRQNDDGNGGAECGDDGRVGQNVTSRRPRTLLGASL